MFRSILVPVDNSPHSQNATKYAVELARHYQASLRGLHVLDIKRLAGPLIHDVAVCLGVTPAPNFQATYEQFARTMGETLLTAFRRKCERVDIPCTTVLKSGIVSEVICKEAHTVDLVVMGNRGEQSAWGSRILGSTFEAILRQINKPTFVVSEYRKGGIRRILVAYDGSDHANSVLKVACEACSAEDLTLFLLTVAPTAEEAEAIQQEARAFAKPYGITLRPILAAGDAPEAIVVNADEIRADVIAMGAYGHSRLRELLVGSTTEFVLRKATCPVLVFR